MVLLLGNGPRVDHAEGAFTCFMVDSDGVLFEGYDHDGPGVCLGDGQTEAEGVPSQGGRGDALLRPFSDVSHVQLEIVHTPTHHTLHNFLLVHDHARRLFGIPSEAHTARPSQTD